MTRRPTSSPSTRIELKNRLDDIEPARDPPDPTASYAALAAAASGSASEHDRRVLAVTPPELLESFVGPTEDAVEGESV